MLQLRFPDRKIYRDTLFSMSMAELVIVPAPGAGHSIATMEFAKRLLERDGQLSITVLVMNHPYAKSSSGTQQAASSYPRIRCIELPQVDRPPKELMKSGEKYLSVYIESHKIHVRDQINNHVLSKSVPFVGLVVDMFCSSMIDVANEFDVPSYVFFTSGAAFLGLMLYLPIHNSNLGTEFSPSDPDSVISTFVNPVPAKVLPSFSFNKDGGYEIFVYHATRFKETKGIFINTFLELEIHPIEALTSEIGTPPLFAVGPLLNLEKQSYSGSNSDREKILKWLDHQPDSSVVFLCFGSYGGFEKPQLAEIATALERSGQRFLWSIRRARAKHQFETPEYTNVSEILPEGFLEQTQNRGLVCGWTPQVEVLAHEAVGGFVSHCGWNSILESVWHGVPIATWPIYAEQQINAFQLVKELELAVELTLEYRVENDDKNIVTADQIEKAITSLMDAENPVRKRVKEMSQKSRNAVIDGGSSFISMERLIEFILSNSLTKL